MRAEDDEERPLWEGDDAAPEQMQLHPATRESASAAAKREPQLLTLTIQCCTLGAEES
jgi:hypothetical protein